MSRPVLNADNTLVVIASSDGFVYGIDVSSLYSSIFEGEDGLYPRLAWRFRTGDDPNLQTTSGATAHGSHHSAHKLKATAPSIDRSHGEHQGTVFAGSSNGALYD